ncbi:MAG: PqqD family protein [Acidimicrobiia bacterium]
MLESSDAPARSASVYTVELDGEAVLLDEAADRLHLLNHTATLLWTLFDGHATIAELAVELSTELDAPYDTVVADILAITRRLGDEGLLTEAPG